MDTFLKKLPSIVETVKNLQDIIITNIVLLGEKSAPTFREKERVDAFMRRLVDFQVDECTTDSYRNPIGIIRGMSKDSPPIFVVAHLDTLLESDEYVNYTIKKDSIIGPAVEDNSAGAGVLISLPRIFRELDLRFQSDIVLAGVIQSKGKGNLRGIRHLLKTWNGPVRGAVCVESVELGRLNYFSVGMVRAEIDCISPPPKPGETTYTPNAILVLNEIINKILELRLPQKPYSKIVIGKVSGGHQHGRDALEAGIGFEIQSDADDIVREVLNDVMDIVESIKRIYEIEINLRIISNLNATSLKFNHPLVKSANAIMRKLNLEPKTASSESELSIFLSRNIPAVTIGITETIPSVTESIVKIEPIFTGITQLIGIIQAIDNGVCDEQKLA